MVKYSVRTSNSSWSVRPGCSCSRTMSSVMVAKHSGISMRRVICDGWVLISSCSSNMPHSKWTAASQYLVCNNLVISTVAQTSAVLCNRVGPSVVRRYDMEIVRLTCVRKLTASQLVYCVGSTIQIDEKMNWNRQSMSTRNAPKNNK